MKRGSRSKSRGQGLVEFSLVIPVFLLILFGLIDLGRFVYTTEVLSQAAREGVRAGSVEASWLGASDLSCYGNYDWWFWHQDHVGGPTCPATTSALIADITSAANAETAGIGGQITNVQISCDQPGNQPTGAWTGSTCSSNSNGNLISVRVTYTWQPFTPIVGQIVGAITSSGYATMVIN